MILPICAITTIIYFEIAKRSRNTKGRDIFNRDEKRPERNDVNEPVPRINCTKREFIENWLNTWSRRTLSDKPILFQNSLDDMPQLSDTDPSSSPFQRSQKTSASVRDADFDNSLSYRNIYIERQNPPTELVQRAKEIILRPRMSPEIDDATAQMFRNKARMLRTEGEQDVIQGLAPIVVPALNENPDPKLAHNSNQVWCNAVPIQLDPDVLADPLPLPRPKPDLAFGYSKTAFDRKQLMAIDLLMDRFGRSYAVPDRKIRFPFLDIEFKSQAKNGTHFIATNQVANAGSIAMNGSLELIRRILGEKNLDLNEPQFFSLSMDHASACLNVHWVSISADVGQFSFHVEGLSKYFLDNVDSLRAVRRAVKNILDYGVNDRLRRLCKALDAYREKVILERRTAVPEVFHASEVQAESLKRQPQRSHTKAPLLSNRRQVDQIQLGVLEEVSEENVSNGSQERLQNRSTQKEGATVKKKNKKWAIVKPNTRKANVVSSQACPCFIEIGGKSSTSREMT